MSSLKNESFYLIDGSGYILELIMRCLHYQESDGLPTGAVSGFCSMLF